MTPAELGNVLALIGILSIGYFAGKVIIFLMEKF